MFTKRFILLALSVALIIAVVIATYQVTHPQPADRATVANPSYVGMGDLRRYEFEASARNRSAESPSMGMGDLRRYEFQSAVREAAVPGNDHPYIGMGDLHRFEAFQEGAGSNNSP